MAIRSWPGRRNRAGARQRRAEGKRSAAPRPEPRILAPQAHARGCRSGSPLAGETGRGKFLASGADVPSTAIGIQPCNREQQPRRREICDRGPHPALGRREKHARQAHCRGFLCTSRWETFRKPRRGLMDTTGSAIPRQRAGRRRRNPTPADGRAVSAFRGSRVARSTVQGEALPCGELENAGQSDNVEVRSPSRHARRFSWRCELICDIRIGPSENSPASAFRVKPRR